MYNISGVGLDSRELMEISQQISLPNWKISNQNCIQCLETYVCESMFS